MVRANLPEFGRITGEPWHDRPLAIIGAGPSLADFDFTIFRNRKFRVLAIKEIMFEMPWADCGFSLDRPFLYRRYPDLERATLPTILAADNQLPRNHPVFERENITMIEKGSGDLLSDDPAVVNSCSTSGFGGLNVAHIKEAKRIALFGFDYSVSRDREGERHHYNDEKYAHHNRSNRRYWPRWATRYDLVAAQLQSAGREVINACPASAITAFPKVSISEGLAYLSSCG